MQIDDNIRHDVFIDQGLGRRSWANQTFRDACCSMVLPQTVESIIDITTRSNPKRSFKLNDIFHRTWFDAENIKVLYLKI